MASMSLQAAYDQARQWLESNDLDRAIGLAQHILDHYPDNLEAYRILGEAYLANRQLDRAQESFERVLRSDPENIPAHVGLGITSERQGQLDRAVAEFEQALEIKPDMAELRSQLLRLYTDGWGSENAQLRLSRAGLARLYAKGHMLPQAIAEFRQVIADQPGRSDAMVALAETLWRDGQEDEAINLCRDILASRPESLKANLLLGYLLMTSGNPEGERYWRAAERMDPYHGVARALFETLPPGSEEPPEIEEWDEAAWRQRKAAEQQEQIAATRPMEAITPVGTAMAGAAVAGAAVAGAVRREPRPAPAPAAPAAAGDDFLASLLAIDTPALPATPAADVSDEDLGLNIDMEPFSLDDLDGGQRPAPTETPAAPEPPSADEPAMTPFSLTDLGLSDEEIAGMDSLNAPAETPAAADEPAMTPFSLTDLGLSDEEIAGMDSLNAPAETPAAPEPPSADEPAMTPFSLADLGLSDEEIASMDSLGLTAETPAAPELPAADEPAMTPFSLADLGLSDEEIASMDSLGLTTETPAGHEPPAIPTAGPDEADITVTPFSLADLGLSDEEMAGLESLQTDTGSLTTPSSSSAAAQPSGLEASGDLPDMSDLPLDLQPFSIDELDLGASDSSTTSIGDLPPALQPFSLDEPPPQRPRVSGFITPENAENEGAADEEDFTPETRGYSWQQATQKPGTSFLKTPRDESQASESSIFAKLKQRHSNTEQPEPEPLPPVTIDEHEHLGLFSMDDVSLRDDSGAASTGSSASMTTDAPVEPEAVSQEPASTPSGSTTGSGTLEIENLEDAVASGQVQPFSFADLGLSEEEIAAMGIGEALEAQAPAAPAEPAPAEPTPPALEIENLEDAVASGQVQPFSFADLGLSEEEIAAMGIGETLEAQTPEAPAEPDLGTLATESADDFNTFLDMSSTAEDQKAEASTESADESPQLTNDLKPFSLADLGLSDEEISALGLDSPVEPDDTGDVGLGLTEEELEGLDGGDLQWALPSAALPAAEPPPPEIPAAHSEPQLTTGDLVVDRLIALGRQQGYVDIADIMADFDDPEAEAARIEEIGRRLHEARIEIRDGDEVIDMEADYEEEEETEPSEHEPALEQPLPTAPAYSPPELDLAADESDQLGLADAEAAISGTTEQGSTGEPDMTPFSLSELGLSEDEINALGLDTSAEAPNPPSTEPISEPDMTPFSLSELGLSEDEIAALGLGEPTQPATPAEPPAEPISEPDMTPFSLNELGLSEDEIAALDLGEPTQSVTPAEPPAEPAETVRPSEDVQEIDFPPAPQDTAPVAEPTPAPAPVETPRAAVPPPAAPPEARPARAAAGDDAPKSTGNEIIDTYLQQLEAEPQNDILRLSVARIGGQIGMADLAVQQYKYLIKRNRLLDQVVEELGDLIADSDDSQLLQRLHRTLGDAYSKQGRFREAVEEYSWTLGGPRGAR